MYSRQSKQVVEVHEIKIEAINFLWLKEFNFDHDKKNFAVDLALCIEFEGNKTCAYSPSQPPETFHSTILM